MSVEPVRRPRANALRRPRWPLPAVPSASVLLSLLLLLGAAARLLPVPVAIGAAVTVVAAIHSGLIIRLSWRLHRGGLYRFGGVRQHLHQRGPRLVDGLLSQVAQRPGAVLANEWIGIAEPLHQGRSRLRAGDLAQGERGRSPHVGVGIVERCDQA